MSRTMRIQYPPAVERWYAALSSVVNFDIFSVQSLGCVLGHSVYTKFWGTMIIPLVISAFMYAVYNHYLYSLHHDGFEDVVIDAVAKHRWKEAKKAARSETLKHQHEYDEDKRKWRKQAIESSEAITDSNTAIHRLALLRAVDVANARQMCVGSGFLLIFFTCRFHERLCLIEIQRAKIYHNAYSVDFVR